MAKIAVELERAVAQRLATGAPGHPARRLLARGEAWTVEDVVCTSGPGDRPFEERHNTLRVAIVTAGSFQYRAARNVRSGRELMTPGSLLLGNPGQYFECEHEHGTGDRCISFGYSLDYFEAVAFETGTRTARFRFDTLHLPPLRETTALVALGCAAITGAADVGWEEFSIRLAGRIARLTAGTTAPPRQPSRGAMRRVTDIVRTIERYPHLSFPLGAMAREARLTPYHFLRVFEHATGLTPHQYLLRVRLREAALRLAEEPARILEIALDCGFGDISNFNRMFRAEFGASPRAYRRGVLEPASVNQRLNS